MLKSWRISAYNAVLVAAYIIPAWALAAWEIIAQPIRGFYAPQNIAFALLSSDHLQLAATGTVQAAWLLVIVRLTVVAFLMLFVLLTLIPRSRRCGDGDEALGIALLLGIAVSMAGMVLAGWADEPTALRLHASETLLLLTAGILFLAEPAFSPVRKASREYAGKEYASKEYASKEQVGRERYAKVAGARLHAGPRPNYGLRGASSSSTPAASLKA